jgi:hypothetical protein
VVTYRDETLKILFALSNNVCSFRNPDGSAGCEEVLVDPKWHSVKARICHIHASSEGGPRYESSMTERDRNEYPNLILLCPNHHTLVDDLEPDVYTAGVLRKMKLDAENNSYADSDWTRNTALIDRAVRQLVVISARLDFLGSLPREVFVEADPIHSVSEVNPTGAAVASVIANVNLGSATDQTLISDVATRGDGALHRGASDQSLNRDVASRGEGVPRRGASDQSLNSDAVSRGESVNLPDGDPP